MIKVAEFLAPEKLNFEGLFISILSVQNICNLKEMNKPNFSLDKESIWMLSNFKAWDLFMLLLSAPKHHYLYRKDRKF